MRNFRFGLVVVWSSVFGLLVTAACSEESEAPKDAIADDSGGDTKDASAAVDARSTNDDAEAKVDAQGSPCNALTVDGVPPSTISAVTAPAPAPVGGVIEDGTYFAVQYVIYGRPKAGPEAPYVRSKVVGTGNVWQAANADPVKAPVTNETLQVTTSGNVLTIGKTCPAQSGQPYPYSVFEVAGKKRFAYYNGKAEVGALIYEKQ